MEWKDGYVTDIEYVYGVYRELAPTALNFVLLIQSIEPVPLQEGFAYCDLGCGQGESINLFAACHPEGDFHGVDFNAAHIAGARTLAANAGLANATFWEASFADLQRLPLPDFDFVVMHGIYSWVGEENRKRILDFLRAKLKPGGVVYLSYNSLPGWSAHAPLRELLSLYADTQPGPLEERVERALEFLKSLKSARALIFEGSRVTGEFFDYICTLPKNYLAHEFFNRDWTLFYHADVVRDLAAAKLSFAGPASFAENQDMLRFTEAQQQIIDDVADRVLRETVKDFAASPLLRRDVFTKGRPAMTGAQQLELFRKRRLALAVPQSELERRAVFQVGEVPFEAKLFDPILLALESGPHSLDELLQRPEIAGLGSGRVLEALMVLLSAEWVMPAAQPELQAVLSSRRLNAVLLERALGNRDRQDLASPVLQNTLKLDWLERLILVSELNREPDPEACIRQLMETHQQRLGEEGQPPQSREEDLAELSRQLEAFRRLKSPLLRQLGML